MIFAAIHKYSSEDFEIWLYPYSIGIPVKAGNTSCDTLMNSMAGENLSFGDVRLCMLPVMMDFYMAKGFLWCILNGRRSTLGGGWLGSLWGDIIAIKYQNSLLIQIIGYQKLNLHMHKEIGSFQKVIFSAKGCNRQRRSHQITVTSSHNDRPHICL